MHTRTLLYYYDHILIIKYLPLTAWHVANPHPTLVCLTINLGSAAVVIHSHLHLLWVILPPLEKSCLCCGPVRDSAIKHLFFFPSDENNVSNKGTHWDKGNINIIYVYIYVSDCDSVYVAVLIFMFNMAKLQKRAFLIYDLFSCSWLFVFTCQHHCK